MSEMYSKVEIVTPPTTGESFVHSLLTSLFLTAMRTLIVWWFVAAWFPEFGFTFWQLVLPVYAARMLFGGTPFQPRILKK